MPKKKATSKNGMPFESTSASKRPDARDEPHSMVPISKALDDSHDPADNRLRRIVSGGQTGVDRAALDVAIQFGLEHGGWVPRGRIAEDGPIPAVYRMNEMPTVDYRDRTLRNVADSDGTLVLHTGKVQGGTFLTTRFAEQLDKPLKTIKLPGSYQVPKVVLWIRENRIATLNVAGPRGSKEPEIYDLASQFLTQLFEEFRKR